MHDVKRKLQLTTCMNAITIGMAGIQIGLEHVNNEIGTLVWMPYYGGGGG